ncbi:hypothetical protein QTQ03_04190 [Micromonospora sp. WMMA1363]|uniref:hypothetical protein n=1 Tax=Micromonospora sp. WMMA1363 TaxID=3053985 RepID=UPI00259CBF5A|nr:hypothetical protein [Micromonospora sp. WMMA1363]MDM4718835.1 hypothetical protein [Micromonospora sp. WMMA1363]
MLGVGANTVGALAPAGRYLVTFPQLGVKETHAQVVAQGFGPHYCHLTRPWSYAFDAEVDVLRQRRNDHATTSLPPSPPGSDRRPISTLGGRPG